jgi:hypothetical protein
MITSTMNDLVYDESKRELKGTALDLNDWARKCTEFQNETGVVIEWPGSTVPHQKARTKEYTLRIPEMK